MTDVAEATREAERLLRRLEAPDVEQSEADDLRRRLLTIATAVAPLLRPTKRTPRSKPKELLTMAEAAKATGKTRDATRKKLQRLGLALRVKGRVFVRADALEALLPYRDLHGRPGRRISMQELGRMRGITTDAAYKWCRRHHVGQKLGGRWMVDTASLVDVVNRQREPERHFSP